MTCKDNADIQCVVHRGMLFICFYSPRLCLTYHIKDVFYRSSTPIQKFCEPLMPLKLCGAIWAKEAQ